MDEVFDKDNVTVSPPALLGARKIEANGGSGMSGTPKIPDGA